jgi:hypothetical protein
MESRTDAETADHDASEQSGPWTAECRGIETLAAAQYQSFEDVVDTVAAERGVERTELRDALAHWLDNTLDAADESYAVPRPILVEAGERCARAAKKQYEEHFWKGLTAEHYD